MATTMTFAKVKLYLDAVADASGAIGPPGRHCFCASWRRFRRRGLLVEEDSPALGALVDRDAAALVLSHLPMHFGQVIYIQPR